MAQPGETLWGCEEGVGQWALRGPCPLLLPHPQDTPGSPVRPGTRTECWSEVLIPPVVTIWGELPPHMVEGPPCPAAGSHRKGLGQRSDLGW